VIIRLAIVLTLLAAVLGAPFAFRPEPGEGGIKAGRAERLVIISPHNESILSEFRSGFANYMRKEYGREVFIDWRQPGGTTEIARFLQSEYSTRFEMLWERRSGLPFTGEIRASFQNAKLDSQVHSLTLAAAEAREEAASVSKRTAETSTKQGVVDDLTLLNRDDPATYPLAARQLFLSSDLGVGIDLFFGGGAYDFDKQASLGNLVANDRSGDFGLAPLAAEHPDWFADDIMPATMSGEPFRDPQLRWAGTVLSAFGLCVNTDVLARLGIEEPLHRWSDLADPRLFGQIALADPTKSGSTTKAFEMLVQERIQTLAMERGLDEKAAVAAGWNDAMRLILKLSANARYFTDSAAKVPRDVAMGDAAVGMCIDFYGRTFTELYQPADGSPSRIQFIMPERGTSIGADPIGMLRGATSPELAHRFLEYALGPEGQKLWNFRPGTPGGPQRFALRRPPIRKDFYSSNDPALLSDPENNPYVLAEGFTYHPEWTGPLFSPLRFLIRCVCIDGHDELAAAWAALIESGMPAEGVAAFEELGPLAYDQVVAELAPRLKAGGKVGEIELARELSGYFRGHFRKIAQKEGVTH
jgi:ABC-type Fe3+ transport system substrate-binding protein